MTVSYTHLDVYKRQETNLANALSGKVSGVQIIRSSNGPAGSSKIQLRGSKDVYKRQTLGSNNQPIYVVDGVILDNSTQGRDMDGEEIDAIDSVSYTHLDVYKRQTECG